MTDLLRLTKDMVRQIEWQEVPVNMDIDDVAMFIVDAIKYLYVMTGRTSEWNENLVIKDEDGYAVKFNGDFPLDEEQYILATATLFFWLKASSSVSEQESYSTDAMAVTNGDKPFKNLTQLANSAREWQKQMWHKMSRYNML